MRGMAPSIAIPLKPFLVAEPPLLLRGGAAITFAWRSRHYFCPAGLAPFGSLGVGGGFVPGGTGIFRLMRGIAPSVESCQLPVSGSAGWSAMVKPTANINPWNRQSPPPLPPSLAWAFEASHGATLSYPRPAAIRPGPPPLLPNLLFLPLRRCDTRPF